MRRVGRVIGVLAALAVSGYAAVQLSPWPSALFYRSLFDRGGWAMNRALERHVPPGVVAVTDERYDADATFDLFRPEGTDKPLPTVVWVHGGGFLSGSKGQVANYLKILAARGYTVVGVEYSIAPAARYPTPVRQVNAALAHLARNAERLRVDPQRFVLAGDSAGAQIAAQLANAVSVPSYAAAVGIVPSIGRAQLSGAILYCGVYDLALANFDGAFGHFLRTVVWSYGGRRDVEDTAHMAEFSVSRFVTAKFPPAFISAGNGDPLLPHSRALADALQRRGVRVETFFFPADHRPALEHEYQFNLDTEAGREALERVVKFLSSATSAREL